MQISLYINNRNECLQLFGQFWTILCHERRESLKKAGGGNNKYLFVKKKLSLFIYFHKTSYYTSGSFKAALQTLFVGWK